MALFIISAILSLHSPLPRAQASSRLRNPKPAMENYSSALSFPSSSSDSLTGMDDIEAGFFGCSAAAAVKPFRRRATYRELAIPPLTTFFANLPDDEPQHFLDSCFLCNKSLAGNGDIFMYRGDTPFCSEECRMEQIEMDEEKEKGWKIYGKKEQQNKNLKKAPRSSKSRTIHFRAGAVVAS